MENCDGRCQGANPYHRDKCVCPCGGMNHGMLTMSATGMTQQPALGTFATTENVAQVQMVVQTISKTGRRPARAKKATKVSSAQMTLDFAGERLWMEDCIHGFAADACVRCKHPQPALLEATGSVTHARYTSECPGCDDVFYRGAPIVMTAYGWAHERCARRRDPISFPSVVRV